MKQRITYYDSLRGIAIIAVVFIHSLTFKDESMMQESIIFRQLINFSVPLFLAISGFFLADKTFSSKQEYIGFLKKQIPRVYLPYAVWSCIFIFLYVVILEKRSLFSMLKSFIIFQTAPIFYYVALILQYYLLLPLLKRYLNKAILPAIIASLSVCAVIFANKYFFHINLPLIIYAGNFLTWLMFFVLGMFLKNNKIDIKVSLVLVMMVFLLCLSIWETNLQVSLFGKVDDAVSAVKMSSFLYSTSVIILLLNFKRNWKLFSSLGQVSYGVFLMHLLTLILVKGVLYKLNFTITSLLTEILIGILNILVSYFICLLIKKINSNISHKYFGI